MIYLILVTLVYFWFAASIEYKGRKVKDAWTFKMKT